MVRFIFNPHSGNNRRQPGLLDALRSVAARRGPETEVAVTRGPGHATELAREAVAAGCRRIVAVGGDGTMNETAQALTGTSADLGLVPCGSGNGLALHLGIPTRPAEALEFVVSEHARAAAIDTGTVNGHVFCNAMGAGLDAEISRRFNRLTRRGLPAYARTTAGALLRFRPLPVSVTDDQGRKFQMKVLLVAVANSDQYGNRARIAPRARADDGQLDLVALRPVGPLGAATSLVRLFSGTLDRSPNVRCLTSSGFVIDRPAPGPVHTDGETHDADARLVVRTVPRSLRILVPSSAPVSSFCHG